MPREVDTSEERIERRIVVCTCGMGGGPLGIDDDSTIDDDGMALGVPVELVQGVVWRYFDLDGVLEHAVEGRPSCGHRAGVAGLPSSLERKRIQDTAKPHELPCANTLWEWAPTVQGVGRLV